MLELIPFGRVAAAQASKITGNITPVAVSAWSCCSPKNIQNCVGGASVRVVPGQDLQKPGMIASLQDVVGTIDDFLHLTPETI